MTSGNLSFADLDSCENSTDGGKGLVEKIGGDMVTHLLGFELLRFESATVHTLARIALDTTRKSFHSSTVPGTALCRRWAD